MFHPAMLYRIPRVNGTKKKSGYRIDKMLSERGSEMHRSELRAWGSYLRTEKPISSHESITEQFPTSSQSRVRNTSARSNFQSALPYSRSESRKTICAWARFAIRRVESRAARTPVAAARRRGDRGGQYDSRGMTRSLLWQRSTGGRHFLTRRLRQSSRIGCTIEE